MEARTQYEVAGYLQRVWKEVLGNYAGSSREGTKVAKVPLLEVLFCTVVVRPSQA
jgi:hypothetical protein